MSLGVMALEEGGRVDFARLRHERRARVDAVMDALGVDVLVLGREYNARYASGARRLAVAGTRPFAPGCVIVRATGECHVMSTWQEGIPEEVPRDHLYGITWNPLTFVGVLAAMDGVATARRVGVDSMTPMFADLLRAAIPEGELVDAEGALRAARMRKTRDEVTCIRTAVAIAEGALVAATDALRPGVRERELLGAFLERMAQLGATVPSVEGTFCVTERAASGERATLRRLPGPRAADAGDLVAMSGGVLYAGYEGVVGRTWPCRNPGREGAHRRGRHLFERWRRVRDSILDACQPGATGADLRAAYEATGEMLPPFPIARSIGLGYEAPIAGSRLGPGFDARWSIEPSMVLAIEAYVDEPDGGYLGVETVLVGEDGPELLSTLGYGPLAVGENRGV